MNWKRFSKSGLRPELRTVIDESHCFTMTSYSERRKEINGIFREDFRMWINEKKQVSFWLFVGPPDSFYHSRNNTTAFRYISFTNWNGINAEVDFIDSVIMLNY